MKPTIGRIVHYWDDSAIKKTPEGYIKNESGELKCYAAIITDVKTQTMSDADLKPVDVLKVYLSTFGVSIGPRSVPFSETPKSGHWTWPSREA